MATRNKTSDVIAEPNDEKYVDEDGVVTDLAEIKKEKDALIEVYNELDRLTIEELDSKLSEIKNRIAEHIKVLEEIEASRNERFAKIREKEIAEHQRVSTDHFIEHKPEVIKEADSPKLPWSEILTLIGTSSILALLIAIIVLLSRQ